MSDPGPMPVAVQAKGYPHTLQVIWVAIHYDLSDLARQGYEFPKVCIAGSPAGAWVAGPLQQARAT